MSKAVEKARAAAEKAKTRADLLAKKQEAFEYLKKASAIAKEVGANPGVGYLTIAEELRTAFINYVEACHALSGAPQTVPEPSSPTPIMEV